MFINNNKKKMLVEILGTVIGAFIMAIGVGLFLLPNQLSSGGVSGLATITYYLFNIPMGTTILVVNIPLFLFAMYKVGRKFLIKSIIGTIALSVFIDFFVSLTPLTQDIFLASIYGGVLIGIGTAVILKSDASTGGSDLISTVIKEYKPTVNMGRLITYIDIVIVLLNIIFLKKIEIGLYSTITILIMGKLIDIVFEGIYFTKIALIVSSNTEQIAKEIGENVKRGATGLYGKGMYLKEEKLVLMCAITRRDISKVKIITKKIDPNSFMIIINSREIMGLGFKN